MVSVQPGPWNDINTWSLPLIPDAANTTSITVNHAVTLPAGYSVTIDGTTVNSTLTVSGTLTVAAAASSLIVNGTLNAQNTAIISGTNGSNLVFNSGSVYQHAYTTLQGAVPLSTWDPNSTIQVTGFTTGKTMTVAGNWTQNFGNFIYNCTAQTGIINFSGRITSVAGDLQVLSTGSTQVYLGSSQNYTLNVGGNFSIEGTARCAISTTSSPNISIGADFIFNSTAPGGSVTSTSGVPTINVGRDILVNAPGGLLRLGYTAYSGGVVFNVVRDMTITAGTILESSNDPGEGTFNFTNGASHNFSSSGSIQNRVRYVVGASDKLTILGESRLEGGVSSSLTLSGELVLSSVNANGAIQTGYGPSPVGNVWVQNRSYQAGAIITYGGSAAQALGNGHPSATNLITRINNASGVALNYSSLTTVIIGDLQLVSGSLTTSTNSLSLQNVTATGGTLALSSTSGSRTVTINGNIQLTSGAIAVTSGASTADLVINGDILAGSGIVSFSGANNRLTVGGSGNFSNPLPLPAGASSIKTINMNRGGNGTLSIVRSVTATDVTISGGNLDINANRTLLILNNLNLGAGTTLFFEGSTLEIQRFFNNTLTGGVLSADATSTLNITGTSTLGTLAFSPSGNTLQSLTLNRTGSGTLVTLNSVLTIANTLTLSDGTFSNVAGLTMNSGSSIVITANAPLAAGSAAPLGGPYDVTYNNGATPVQTSMVSGAEAQGSVNNLNMNLTGTLTAGTAMAVGRTLFLNAGVFANTASRLTMASGSAIVRSSGGNLTLSAPLGGPYDLTYTGTSLTNNRESYGSISDLTTNCSGTVSITSAMTVTGTAFVNSGTVNITGSTLIMGNGATFQRASGTSVTGSAPGGGPYHLIYTGTNLTTQQEIQGSLNAINSQVSGTVTQGNAVSGAFNLTVESGTWTCGANALSLSGLVNQSTFNAPSSTLTLTSNLTNDGSFNANGGTTIFNGTSTINGTTSVTLFNITVNAGATFNSPAALNVDGDVSFPVGAVFNALTGAVNLTGGGAQNLDVNGTRFNNITVSKAGGMVSLMSSLNLAGILSIASATTFDSGGFLTVLSQPDGPGDDVASDGSIGAIASGGSVINNVTVQRYMLTKGKNNKYVSAPVGGVLLSDITDDMTVNPGYWRKYLESQNGPASLGYFNLNSGDFPLEAGRGYLAFLDGGVDIMWDVTGGINSGDTPLPVTYTNSTPTPRPADDGWNLVGNPYPSPIQWNNNAAAWDRTNVDPIATVYENVGSSVANGGTGIVTNAFTYNYTNGTGNLPNGLIATGQAFWVHLSAAGSLVVKEPAKTVIAGGKFLRTQSTGPEQLMISLSGDGFRDNSFLVVDRQATPAYDRQYDGLKFMHPDYASVYFVDHARRLSMNAVPGINDTNEFALGIQSANPGVVRIQFSDLDRMSGSEGFFLIDKQEGSAIPVRELVNQGYPVTITNPSQPIEGRFYLSKKPRLDEIRQTDALVAYPNPARDYLTIEAGGHVVTAITLTDASGNTVRAFSGETRVIDMREISGGVYFLRLTTTEGIVVKRILKYQ